MRAPTIVAFAIIGFAAGVAASACGPSRGDDSNPPVAHIEVTPADSMMTITNGVAMMQQYTATYVDVDGNRSDITSSVVFSLQNPVFGVWTAANLRVTGGGAGPTRVVASRGDLQGDTGLTVFVKNIRVDATA